MLGRQLGLVNIAIGVVSDFSVKAAVIKIIALCYNLSLKKPKLVIVS